VKEKTMALPLDNVRILDFTIMMQGPHGTMLLGDLGAEIIKVERPARLGGPRGLPDERYGLHGGYGKNPEENTWYASSFLAHNRNKKSITVDLRKPEGRVIILRLVEQCAVVYENFRPGVMDRLGLGYEDCRRVNPSIIYASATGYGPDGPYAHRPGQDLLAQGLSGIDVVNAPASGRPTPVAYSIPDLLGGIYGAYGVLGALYYRQRTGEGQRVNVCLLDSGIASLSEMAVHCMNTGAEPARGSEMHAIPFIPSPYGVYKTKDGYISISGAQTVPTLSRVLGVPNMAEDTRFDTFWKRVNNRAEMDAVIEEATKKKTTAEWIELMEKADLWAAPVNTLPQAFCDPQVLHNQMILTVDSPAGPLKMPGFPYKLSKTPAQVRMPPPLLGQHTEEILREAGYSVEEVRAFQEAEVI
jgi:crotonobetainyl-CoA:carnitine CoA-transferase CaiB-like acyl-CoA transferase